MNAAKVVVSEVERERGFQVLPLLRKANAQASEPAHGIDLGSYNSGGKLLQNRER